MTSPRPKPKARDYNVDPSDPTQARYYAGFGPFGWDTDPVPLADEHAAWTEHAAILSRRALLVGVFVVVLATVLIVALAVEAQHPREQEWVPVLAAFLLPLTVIGGVYWWAQGRRARKYAALITGYHMHTETGPRSPVLGDRSPGLEAQLRHTASARQVRGSTYAVLFALLCVAVVSGWRLLP